MPRSANLPEPAGSSRRAKKSKRPVLFGSFVAILVVASLYYGQAFMVTAQHPSTPRSRQRATLLGADEPPLDVGAAAARLDVAAQVNEARHQPAAVQVQQQPMQQQPVQQPAQQQQPTQPKVEVEAPAAAAAAAVVAQPQHEEPAAATAAGASPDGAACPPGRRPYHVIMTAATGTYQEWQSRIAYYHYQKMKRLNPCSDIGGFTRLFNTPNAQPDGLMDEMPTLLVKQLGRGMCDECDHGFIVMNRPWGVVQMVQTEHFKNIPEEYAMVIETDHMMMMAVPNTATPEKPVGFGFYYMIGTDPKLQPVVEQFLAPGISPTTVDAVGPSPIIITKEMLARVARPWWDMSLKMKGNRDANRVFGWVLEMWGYNLAARNMGIRHTVSQSLQVEPQGTGTDDMDGKYIYHYTFHQQAAGWRIDKRQYYGGYPSDQLPLPPVCSPISTFIHTNLWTEAARAIKGWPRRDKPLPPPDEQEAPLRVLERSSAQPQPAEGLTGLLVGTGPWEWGKLGEASAGLFLFARGVAFVAAKSPIPGKSGSIGRWKAVGADRVELQLCGQTYALLFERPDAPWTFSAQGSSGEPLASGRLLDSLQQVPLGLTGHAGLRVAPLVVGDDAANYSLAEQVFGSGPWQWAGHTGLAFLRGGRLVTPWGQGTWGVQRRNGAETAPHDRVFADFGGGEHSLRAVQWKCLHLGSVRKADGEKVRLDYAGGTPVETSPSCLPQGSHIAA